MTEKDLKVRIYKKETTGPIKASVAVTFGDMFVINGIKIIEGSKGLFVAMPSRPKKVKGGVQTTPDGKVKYLDIFHPVTVEGRQLIEKVIMEEYNKL